MSDNVRQIDVGAAVADMPPEVHAKMGQLQALMEAVDRDNPSGKDISDLRQMFAEVPGLWAVFGDVSAFIQEKIVGRLVGNRSISIPLERGIDLQREGLGYEHAPALERLLIDHVVICWLRWQDAEWRYTQMINQSIPLARANYWEKRLSAAQRRYLRACETLARVRKIVRITPVLQVNIAAEGGQQVNVLGDVEGA